MDLTQLANLGEFIGGVAVLVTLIYLAVQVRQGTTLARASAQRETNAGFQSALAHLRQELGIYRRGCVEFDSMSHHDQHCFELTVAPVINHLDQVIRMHKQGLETQGQRRRLWDVLSRHAPSARSSFLVGTD